MKRKDVAAESMRPEAVDEMLLQVARMVGRWAAGWSYVKLLYAVSADDLIQIAWIGAWKAAQSYDARSRTTFRSWVSNGAKHALQHYVRDELSTRRGVSRMKYERRNGSLDLGMPLSLDAAPPEWKGEEHQALLETIVGEQDPADQAMATVVVERVLRNMPVKWARVLWAYYGAGYRQMEIARLFGISQKQVSRQIQQGLWRARAALGITPHEIAERMIAA